VRVAQWGGLRGGRTIDPQQSLAILVPQLDANELDAFCDPLRDETLGCGTGCGIVREKEPVNRRIRGSPIELRAERKNRSFKSLGKEA
jgi:hypothetical protein